MISGVSFLVLELLVERPRFHRDHNMAQDGSKLKIHVSLLTTLNDFEAARQKMCVSFAQIGRNAPKDAKACKDQWISVVCQGLKSSFDLQLVQACC